MKSKLRKQFERLIKDAARTIPGAERLPVFRSPIPYSPMELERLVAAGKRGRDYTKPVGNRFDQVALFEGRVTYPRFEPHLDYRLPGEGVLFASVCNDKYAPGLEALILSLLEVYPKFQSPYVVFHDDSLSEFTQSRLRSLYSGFEFRREDPNEFDVRMENDQNHKRVGRLGSALRCATPRQSLSLTRIS